MKLGKAVTYPGLEGVFFFKNICVCVYIYIWLHQILVVAQGSSFFVVVCRIFSCGMWDLVPWPRIKPRPPALGAQILTTGQPGKSPEDVSLYGNILCSLRVPGGFGEELGLSWAWAASLLTVCWQPPLWWELRLDLEGLELEPGTSWGFSDAQWPSLPSWDQGWGLRGWSWSPKADGFLPGVMAVFISVWDMPENLRIHFYNCFTLALVCTPWWEAGQRKEELMPPTKLAQPPPMCAWRRVPQQCVSVLELTSFSPVCARQRLTGNGCLQSGQR